jgi:hypothetical protein
MHSVHRSTVKKQHVGAGARLRHTRRARKPTDARPAAEPEHRQPLDVGAEGEAVHQHRLEARDGEPGDGVGDDDVDVAQGEARIRHRLARDLLE